MARLKTLGVALALASLLGVACGSDSSGQPTAAGRATDQNEATFPVTVAAANGSITIEERPTRIVSLSPTATELLFAVGAGDQVVAVDDFSNYPPEAPTTDLSGYEPNVEAIASYDPDLVVYSNDPGDLEDALKALDIPTLLQPAAVTLEDTYEQIEEIGNATGHAQQATELNASIEEDIQRIIDSLPTFDDAPTYFHELDNHYFTATSKTFIGQVYGLLGLRNIADKADEDGSGYPQLSGEYIIEADPDLIFLADTKCCNQSASTVAKRPGWDQISAVRNDAVVKLDDDIASRWGPRVVDFLETVADAVIALEAART